MGLIIVAGQFIAWLSKLAWKWGSVVISAVIRWAKNHLGDIIKWLGGGATFEAILQWILRVLGLA